MKYNITLNKIYTDIFKLKNKNKKLTSLSITIDSLIKHAELRVMGYL